MSDGTSLNTVTNAGQTYLASDFAAMQNKLQGSTNKTLDKDAFLQLLVTQMRYQDPLDPQDNSEYVAQLAQFSALEQMTNVAKVAENISKLVSNIDTSVLVGQLSSMIGQDVQWMQSTPALDNEGHAIVDKSGNPVTTSQTYEGKVTGVSVTDGSPTIIASVNGKSLSVSIGDVIRVGKMAEQV